MVDMSLDVFVALSIDYGNGDRPDGWNFGAARYCGSRLGQPVSLVEKDG